MHLLVGEQYGFQNARCNNKNYYTTCVLIHHEYHKF
jgi:hypothetical protein